MLLSKLVGFLDGFLRVAELPDHPHALNGLQVENTGSVSRILAAVDACQGTIDAAVARNADMLLVHHGLFWSGLKPVVGRDARRLRALLEGNVALYSAHIPLDVHPEVGNNAILARHLGLSNTEPFGSDNGIHIGVAGHLGTERGALAALLEKQLGSAPRLLAGGPDQISRVAIVTGAGSSFLRQAHEAGIDTFITGEGAHHTFFDAEEWGMNVFYAGHYATETLGVKALAQLIADRYGIEWEFFDYPTGM